MSHGACRCMSAYMDHWCSATSVSCKRLTRWWHLLPLPLALSLTRAVGREIAGMNCDELNVPLLSTFISTTSLSSEGTICLADTTAQ